MPKNSVAHVDRLAKVKQGFTAAGISAVDVAQIMAVFDMVPEETATVIAQRTEYSVSTSSKLSESIMGSGNTEQRRQMARASIFLGDLKTMYEEAPLPAKLTAAEFERLWRSDFALLKGLVTSLAKGLSAKEEEFRLYREIVTKEFRKSDPPRGRPVVISDDARRLLTAAVGNKGHRIAEVQLKQTSFQTLKTGWLSAQTQLLAAFATTVNSTTSNTTAAQTAATAAYGEFEAFFREVGKENEAKIAMAKSFFSALSSYAPFPLSIVGKIGGAACGLAHADTAIGQERRLGPPKYFDTNIPTLEKFNAKLGEVKNWSSDLTRLGVDGGALPSGTSIQNAIDMARGRTVALLNKIFLSALEETYGSNPTEQANKSTEFYTRIRAGLGGPGITVPEELIAQTALNKITALSTATKAAIESTGTLVVVNASDIQPFIELQLIAEFLAAFIPDQNFTKAIPEGLIKRLESPPFELVVRKTSSNQTDRIYASKKLPWKASHPRHTGALIYFFRWYKTAVNPFDLATGRVTVTGLKDAMGDAISEIGTAVQAHKQKRRLRSGDTADWGKVTADLASMRTVV